MQLENMAEQWIIGEAQDRMMAESTRDGMLASRESIIPGELTADVHTESA